MRKSARAIGAAILAVATAWPAAGQNAGITGAFSLTEAPGRIVRNSDFHSKYLLVLFGYTSCPDICPNTLHKIAQALHLMGSSSSQVQAVFITVDPDRDTPAVIANYVALFSPNIIGLSGSTSQIAMVEQHYHVYVSARDPITGAIAHSAILFIIRADGQFVTALPDSLSASGIATTLIKLDGLEPH